jgi:hypothetical protein
MSVHRLRDGVWKIRWREGGHNRSLRLRGSYELVKRSNARKCQVATRTGIWI